MSLWAYKYLLLKGIFLTFGTWLASMVISLLLGTIWGTLSCRQVAVHRFIKQGINLYALIAKAIPAYVQILIAYFVLPSLFGVQIRPLYAAIGALSFCSAGYVTQIIKAGIDAINPGQWQACFVLGYSQAAALKRVILPQVFKHNLASLLGEFEQLLKSTSLLATIGLTELTRAGMNIISRELNPVPVYLLVTLIYLLFSIGLNFLSNYLEKRFMYGCY